MMYQSTDCPFIALLNFTPSIKFSFLIMIFRYINLDKIEEFKEFLGTEDFSSKRKYSTERNITWHNVRYIVK